MADRPSTGVGFDGLRSAKNDHSLDLERARAARKAASEQPSAIKPVAPLWPQRSPLQGARTPNQSRQAEDAPPSVSSPRGWWLVIGCLCVLVGFAIAFRYSPSIGLPSAPVQGLAEAQPAVDAESAARQAARIIEAHVIAEQANVRSAPSMQGAVVTALPRMQVVNVIGKEGAWSQIVAGSGVNSVQGYIASKLLFEGDAQATRAYVCDLESSSTPYSGEVLVRSGHGNNRLTVNAGGSDVLVKLRQSGSTALSFYVRSGERGVIEDVPDGTYQVMFATGDGFSRKCLEFVNSMSISADPDPVTFETRISSDGYNQYTQNSSAEYTLTRQVGGNFTPRSLSESDFRE